jgi:hypothetical protein
MTTGTVSTDSHIASGSKLSMSEYFTSSQYPFSSLTIDEPSLTENKTNLSIFFNSLQALPISYYNPMLPKMQHSQQFPQNNKEGREIEFFFFPQNLEHPTTPLPLEIFNMQ